MLTADEAITSDMEHIFVHLASQNKLPKLNKLLMAPFLLQDAIVETVDKLAQEASQGKAAKITCKMNSLTDVRIAKALLNAAAMGVKIDLIVRGACILPTDTNGEAGNIRVRSVIGRFLEHTRVFHFSSPSTDQLWLASADFMSRNMIRRIELAWPVQDPSLKARVLDEGLGAYLKDTENAWELLPDGTYESTRTSSPPAAQRPDELAKEPSDSKAKRSKFDVHLELMSRYGSQSQL